MTISDDYIPRTLFWTDKERKSHEIVDEAILNEFQCPVVILGEPGMGKTTLMEMLGTTISCRSIKATSLLRLPDKPLPRDERLIIDGLDEVAALGEGDPLHNVLKKLLVCGKPNFVISCRSAEWRGATAREDIVDDYGDLPQELTLEPLTENDAISALARQVDQRRAEIAINKLNKADLSSLYQNPLTLAFVVAIVKTNGQLPPSRAELYDLAVAQLRLEKNERHAVGALAKMSEEDALDAAGAVMAAMLIAGKDGIVKFYCNDDSKLCPSDLSDIADVENAEAILGSKLFRVTVYDPTCTSGYAPNWTS